MVGVSGLESRGNQPLFFEAKEPSRFQRLKDWAGANREKLVIVGVVSAIALTALSIACALTPAPASFGLALAFGIPCAIGLIGVVGYCAQKFFCHP